MKPRKKVWAVSSYKKQGHLCSFVKAAVVVMLSSVLLFGCGILPKEEELPAAPVLTEGETEEYVMTEVIRGDIQITENIRCNLVASASEKLSFKVGGEYVKNVYAALGESVKAGDLIMELDVSDIDAQINQQQNSLDMAELKLSELYEDRALDLEQAALLDQQNPNLTVSNTATVEQRYQTQEQMLNDSISVGTERLKELQEKKKERQIVASINGTVTFLYSFQEGEATVEGQQVAVISDMARPLFEVYSDNASLLTEKETYELVSGGKTYSVEANTGSTIGLSTLKPEGMYLELSQMDPELKQGDTGTITLIKEESKDTLLVDAKAVSSKAGETEVYILNENGFKEARAVKVGLSNGKVTEILEGLEEGDTVVLP